jgi:hypothetical protein
MLYPGSIYGFAIEYPGRKGEAGVFLAGLKAGKTEVGILWAAP